MSRVLKLSLLLDQIRHCIIFHRIGEGDSGVYSVQAVNPLGEAVCEAEFQVVPGEGGEGGEGGLYIPEKWKTGNRLDWAKEDKRAKPFEGVEDPGLSDEERAAMFKRFEKPLPRALEYLASLPDYHPKPFETLPQVPFKVKQYQKKQVYLLTGNTYVFIGLEKSNQE